MSFNSNYPALVIHDQHPILIQTQLHLLRPNARRLLQLQQPSNAIGRQQNTGRFINGERGQMLQQMQWFIAQVLIAVRIGRRASVPSTGAPSGRWRWRSRNRCGRSAASRTGSTSCHRRTTVIVDGGLLVGGAATGRWGIIVVVRVAGAAAAARPIGHAVADDICSMMVRIV